MTNSNPLVIGGIPAHRWLLRERTRLATDVTQRMALAADGHRWLPFDLTAVVEDNLGALAEVLRRREVPAAPQRRMLEMAVRGAEEGMPPTTLMDVYHLAFAEIWRMMTARAEPGDLPDVLACTELVLAYLHRVTEVVVTAYSDERAEDQDMRYRLASALMSGEPVEGLAARAGVRLASSYLVMTLSMEESTALAVHRMVRELNTFGEGPALTLIDGAGGTVLVPWPGSWEEVEGLVARLSEVGRTAVTAAAGQAAPGEVPEQVRQTREILDVVRWFGRGPGLYRLADILVEYQLTRLTAATPGLAALIAPLDGHPDLLATLETHLRHGRARKLTARALHVHPNTVDYRLRRVAQLTGLDPTDDTDMQRIAAALAATRTPH
ncbi:PucR family transcriptional regulator [Sinosporangium siamense]|uniref:Transcriptional regulator n=1 Tax=Sinosporangium siamense TaxID=1367973 RepID=A0A919RMP0_9ACTN|nr:helix-turn-helix domain-containing protein [Sinosporangium siamense]GII96012.1 transcriptional regulator [Sinosporangium siamense]